MTYVPAKFEIVMCQGFGEDKCTRKYITQGHMKCCPVPLYHVTNAPANFEVATCEGFGDAFTRKYSS